MKTLTPAFLLLLAFATSLHAAPFSDTENYLGTVGQTPVAVIIKRHDARITGEIIHLGTGAATLLDGTASIPQKLTLRESKPDGTVLASLNLATPPGITATGDRAAGHGTQSIRLTQVASTFYLITADSARYTVSTGYLQFPEDSPYHSALNLELHAQAVASHAKLLAKVRRDTPRTSDIGFFPSNCTVEPRLLFAGPTLTSIRLDHDDYIADAVHDVITFSAVNIAWKGNKLQPLAASSLLDTRPAAKDAFTDLCIQSLTHMKVQDPDFAADKGGGALNFTSTGLLLSYDDYALGAYSQGEIFLPLPYSSLTSFISADSPLAPLLPRPSRRPSVSNTVAQSPAHHSRG